MEEIGRDFEHARPWAKYFQAQTESLTPQIWSPMCSATTGSLVQYAGTIGVYAKHKSFVTPETVGNGMS